MIAALFVRADSHYKQFEAVDCFDEKRDALTWAGGTPGIFHPPCRSWAKLKGFAKPVQGEKELALWSMQKVRQFGGVLEHPLHSELWKASQCLRPGIRDLHGGVLITLNQREFGHRAQKATGLYLVGITPPATPFELLPPVRSVEMMGRSEREKTPRQFAEFLIQLANLAH